jgi:CRP/FNR family transcriptional regulator, cyclic AMP receptor protein
MIQFPDWLTAARTYGLLSRLPDAVVRELTNGSHRVEYPTGTVAVGWDEGSVAWILLRGSLRGFLSSPQGNQVTTRYLRPGDTIGMLADRRLVLARGVQVLEPSEVLVISQDRVRELAMSEPLFAWAVIEELATMVGAMQRALHIRGFRSVRQRVISAILDRAQVSGGVAAGKSVTGTQHELAIAIGSVREVVASVLQELKREGLIDIHRGRVVILQPDKLAVEANGTLGVS